MIEDEEDGNIACPAFPYPLIDYDDFDLEADTKRRPWEEQDKVRIERSASPEEKKESHWVKLTSIILSKNEKPNLPLIHMATRAKEEQHYWE